METPNALLYNLQTLKASDAKRMWRERIFERDGHRCTYCGSTENLTIDHIIPRCRGGARWDASNCRTACRSCNQMKGSMDLSDFMFLIAA